MLLRLRTAGLVAWVVGVQSLESVATVGLAMTAVSMVPQLREVSWRQWRWLLVWLAWVLVVPLLGGALPTGSGVARTLDWLALPLVSFAVWSLPSRRVVVSALGATLAVSCVLAGLQHVGVFPAPESLGFLEWTKLPFARVTEPIPNAPGRFMGGGLIFHRLKFAHVSAVAILALVFVGTRAGPGRDRTLAFGVAIFATLSVWVFPHARMAAIALGAALTVEVGLLAPRRRLGFVLATGVLVAGALTATLVDSVRERLERALTAEGAGDRGEILATGVLAVKQHPLTGVGLGQFRPSKFATATTPTHVIENPGKAHNQFVSMAAEAGIPGLVLFVVLLVNLAKRARQANEGALTLAALTLFVALSLAHDPLFQPTFSMSIVLALGAGLRDAGRTEAKP
jgi:O-antigen ligase